MVRSEQSGSGGESGTEGGDVSADIQTLKDDLAQLRDDVSSMASSWMSRGRERVSDFGGSIQDQMQDKVETVTDWVKDHPIQTIVIAGISGLILGKIMRK